MSVKIEMEMPNYCSECKFCIYEPPHPYCALTNSQTSLDNTRPSWCPLQEVKE